MKVAFVGIRGARYAAAANNVGKTAIVSGEGARPLSAVDDLADKIEIRPIPLAVGAELIRKREEEEKNKPALRGTPPQCIGGSSGSDTL